MHQTLILKRILSLGLLAIAIYAGFAKFSLGSILFISIPFTIAYIQGKWYLWKDVFQSGGRKLYQSLLTTYLIQLGAIAIFYLLGSGIARLFNQ